MSNTFTVVSLNLWRFYDWEKRLPVIVELLKKINPDIICTQETQRNTEIDSRNQIEILNQELGFPYSFFSVADMKYSRKGVIFPTPVEHGLGVLSHIPLTTEKILLTKGEGDKEQRIVLKCEGKIDRIPFVISNLHFSNSDTWAENHFKETLSIYKERNILSILVGDFNIFDIQKYKKLYGMSYKASSECYSYISYPADNASLDYVLIPQAYEFEDFSCLDEYVSDHRMLVAKIKIST